MEDLTTENSYEEAKGKAKVLYSKIGRVWCPALNDSIVFSGDGFRHLVWKGRIPRYKSEQRRRFSLLRYVAGILEDPAVMVVHEENIIAHTIKIGGQRTSIVSTAHFWRVSRCDDGKLITIIVRQIDNHEKHFFSVFEGRQKSTQ